MTVDRAALLHVDALMVMELGAQVGATPLGLRGAAIAAASTLYGPGPVVGRLLHHTRELAATWEHNRRVLEEAEVVSLSGEELSEAELLAWVMERNTFELDEKLAQCAARAVAEDELDPLIDRADGGAEALTQLATALTLEIGAQLGTSASQTIETLWPSEWRGEGVPEQPRR